MGEGLELHFIYTYGKVWSWKNFKENENGRYGRKTDKKKKKNP